MTNKKIVTNYVISEVKKKIYQYFEDNCNSIINVLKNKKNLYLSCWLKENNIILVYPEIMYYYDENGNCLKVYQDFLMKYLFENVQLRFTDILSIIIKDPFNKKSTGLQLTSDTLTHKMINKIDQLKELHDYIQTSGITLVKGDQ